MRLLVVEDEPKMGQMLKRGFVEEGYLPFVVKDGNMGLEWALAGEFDLIVLDVMLPSMDGFEFARRYRLQGGQRPILMLTARDAPPEQIKGLDAGADDYLTKPFLFDVLLARVRALARRSAAPNNAELRLGACTIHFQRREVFIDGQAIALSKTEFDLLSVLARHAGKVVTREDLIHAIWGSTRDVENGTLDTFIRLLRSKLNYHLIDTVRGVGYIVRRTN